MGLYPGSPRQMLYADWPRPKSGSRPLAANSLKRWTVCSNASAGTSIWRASSPIVSARLTAPCLDHLFRQGALLRTGLRPRRICRHSPRRRSASTARPCWRTSPCRLRRRSSTRCRTACRSRRRRWPPVAAAPEPTARARGSATKTDGSHQASSSRSVFAPSRIAVCRTSPVSPALAIDHFASLGWSPLYRRRISALRLKPPAASRTPLRAWTLSDVPSRVTRAPTTRPSSTMRSSIAVFVQIGGSPRWSIMLFSI